MASFTNFATLSYNGGTTNSNIVTGEILEALTAVKTAVSANYSAGDRITYALSLVNTGTAAITDYTVTDNLGRAIPSAQTPSTRSPTTPERCAIILTAFCRQRRPSPPGPAAHRDRSHGPRRRQRRPHL